MAKIRSIKRAKDVIVAVNADYSEELPKDTYRSVALKLSGTMAASGAGANAIDGPFNFLGRVEVMRGSDAVIAMHAIDLRHLCSFLQGAHGEILPASVANGAIFLAQVDLQLDKLIPDGAIDGSKGGILVKGRFRGAPDFGATATAVNAGSLLKITGETDELPNGDHFEPHWVQDTADTSSANPDISKSYEVKEDVEVVTAIMLRTYDASAAAGDPNAARSDGMVRNVRIECNRKKGTSGDVARATWAELKARSTSRYGISSVAGQISSGVVLVLIEDPDNPELGKGLRLERGDSLTVHLDTAATVEPEFTALTAASGDLCHITYLNAIPRGPGVEAAKAQRR